MATVQTIFGTNAISDTITNVLTALNTVTDKSQNILVIFLNDIKTIPSSSTSYTLPDSGTTIPSNGEDWLALLTYHTVDVTSNTQNAVRNFSATQGALSIDNGYYIPGQTFQVSPVTINFYVPSSLNQRPTLAGL